MKNWQQTIVIFSLLFAVGLVLPRWISTFHQEKSETITKINGDGQVNSEKIPIMPELNVDTVISSVNMAANQVEKEKEEVKNIVSLDKDIEPNDGEGKPLSFHRVLLSSKTEKIAPNPETDKDFTFHAIVFGNQEISNGDQLTMLVEEKVEIGAEVLKRNEMIYPKVKVLGDTLILNLRLQENDFTGFNREEKMIILPVKQEGKLRKIFKNNKVQSIQPTLKITDKFLVTFKKDKAND